MKTHALTVPFLPVKTACTCSWSQNQGFCEPLIGPVKPEKERRGREEREHELDQER